ncbi:Rab3 GTPase-activating protein catalytic subunit [Mortierella sp. AD011]|nr:Rab3 GTPase-activating protein catalytic subunit [Mortierella sp. AD011]
MDDFENFEFIDYTTSGPWERFITQIEDSLRSFGLTNKKRSLFEPRTTVSVEGRTGSPSHTSEHIGHHGEDNSGSAQPYQLREMLTLDDATYSLSYHYNPARSRAAAGAERIDLEFLPKTLEGVRHHSLHRWTSLTHLLVISPVTIPDIFASGVSSTSVSSAIIDLSSAKLLLSSFAIAFQNTGCNVPVFVPTGQPWNLTFIGLMIQPEIPTVTSSSIANEPGLGDVGLEDDEDSQGIEVRFNTTLIPYPEPQYTHLAGVMDYFVERMGIEENDPTLAPGTHSQSTNERVYVSALFSYDLVNWHDEDWRRWEQGKGGVATDRENIDADVDPTFQVDESLTETIPDANMNMDDIKTESRSLSTLPVPVLPFGPVQDPLHSLRLLARFACAPSNVYLDSINAIEMDAYHANILILQAVFKEDDYSILSGIIEDTILSWNSEAISNGRDGKSENDQPYASLLNKGARLIQGTINMVDVVDVENIVDALFESSQGSTQVLGPTTLPESAMNGRLGSEARVIPASELSLQFRHAAIVPCNSFLWRMLQYLLDVISPNSEISYATSVMGFMKVLWPELLKQFYSRWENSQMIPFVDVFGECNSSSSRKSTEASSSNQEKKPAAIDLRYNLLHQKLSMINCCIARQIQRNKDAHTFVHPVARHRKNKSKDISAGFVTPANTTQGPDPVYSGRATQFQNLFHGLSDIQRPRSSDVIPIAKRLLETVKNRAIPPHQGVSPSPLFSSGISGFSISQSELEVGLPSPTAAVPIPKRDSSQWNHDGSIHVKEMVMDSEDDGEGEDVFYDSAETNELFADPQDMQRRTYSMSESFVALKYSSSVDSQSGVIINDFDQSTSVNASGPDPREVADDTKSEGGLMPLKDLKLLQTGAPLLIPKLQEPGYMTEDMIQQQEELFETLGSSSDGAKMRARMQSTQLTSDMEAFKAANPGCVLGDFIRWHSPKDWVEDKGEMSARMADAGNYWQELWARSKRIPVSRQTPLFNHNQEAAKALYYLDSISSDQLFIQLLPTMFLVAYDTLVSQPISMHIRQVAVGLKDFGHCLTRFRWDQLSGDGGGDANLNVIVGKLGELELLMGRAIALVRKFPEQYDMVERILDDGETVLEDGPERECVYDLFSTGGSSQSFPQPTCREFILETFDPVQTSKVVTESDGLNSRPLQRRMYACLKESELRIVEAVAKDGLYM